MRGANRVIGLGFVCLIAGFAHSIETKPPILSAASAIVIEADTGKVIWEKDADTQRFPASTTKIMTALLLIEKCRPDEQIVAPEDVEKVGGSSLYMKAGETLSAHDLLYALMLRSANDGCFAVANHISGSVESFADLMNSRAKQIGCKNTKFHNPHGLNDDKHVTSARDLALIAREAMKYPEFRQVARTKKYTINRPQVPEDQVLISKNKWLSKDASADGIKTGWTVPAGYCYVGSANRDGMRVITVVLKSESWQEDHKALLDYAFASSEKVAVAKPMEAQGDLPVAGGASSTVPVGFTSEVDYVRPIGSVDQPKISFDVSNPIQAPVKAGQPLGTATITDDSGWSMSVPIIATSEVKAASALPFLPWWGWIVIGIGVTIAYVRSKLRPKRRRRGF